jgi:hypothetical protein
MMRGSEQQRLWQKCRICGDSAAPAINTYQTHFSKALISRITFIRRLRPFSLVHRCMFFDQEKLESGVFVAQRAERRAFAHKSLNQKSFVCSATTRNLG